LECGSYEYRIRQQIKIDDNQLGFMKNKGTTDVILIVRQMQTFRVKTKKLYWLCGFEKAIDRIVREMIRWPMCKLGVEEWLVSAVMSIYTGAKTVVNYSFTLNLQREKNLFL